MGLLAPLYIAGLLAISLPILFHLIRRTPHGRQEFGSLMFLSPSPPRLTRRSRLSNILLLLLRAAAFALLAFAFTRPFLQRNEDMSLSRAAGKRVAILVDASASMRRGDLWQQAVRHAAQAARDAAPADEVALYFFDRRVRPAMTFSEWNELEPSRRVPVLEGRLAEAGPTWESTNVGDALATVADLLSEATGTQGGEPRDGSRPTNNADKTGRQLVLVSDLQQGGRVESLQGYQWPPNVLLDVKRVAPKEGANAGVQAVRDATGAAPDVGAATRLRVRVANQPDSKREQFELVWATNRGSVAGAQPFKAYVPPGRSQVVRVPDPAAGERADRLVLRGDDHDFDNTLYVVPPRSDTVRVIYVGDDGADDTKGLRYYLESALGGASQRKVDVVARKSAEPLAETDLLGARLIVVGAPLAEDRVATLRRFAETGGDVLWVLKEAAASPALEQAIGVGPLAIEEATGRDFALLARVELGHPLFAPFADTRFSDFTRIHFWKHRRLKLPADAKDVNVVAAFDNGDPFLLERPIGQGRLLVATSGWNPADSQLALSTKFVPLIEGLVRPRGTGVVETQHAVGDAVALPPAATGEGARSVTTPDGRQVQLPAAATSFDGTTVPGIYRLGLKSGEVPVAVNVSADEGRTAPLAIEELERLGARLGNNPTSDELVTKERKLKLIELESRQKLWRWLIVAVLGLLAVETLVAGRLARRDLSTRDVQQ